MENKIKYSFNTGDKVKVIQGGWLFADILKGATGIITDEINNNGMMNITNGFNLEIIEPESFKGQIWRLGYYGIFELLETTNFKGCERLQYKDSKKYKTIIKDGFITFKKNDDYIIGVDWAKKHDEEYDDFTRGVKNKYKYSKTRQEWFKNNVVTVEQPREAYICIKNCIYEIGSKVEIMRKVKDFIIVTDGKSINPFRCDEFEEYFTEYIDVNEAKIRVVSKTKSETDRLMAKFETAKLNMERAVENCSETLDEFTNKEDK